MGVLIIILMKMMPVLPVVVVAAETYKIYCEVAEIPTPFSSLILEKEINLEKR